ncbi:polyprenyl synthetase family protein [uncultured Clostridium sp.]|uniref:polyprenyl synthetase family protein n=1 Tax=uncultured Clostridium sp. TaxID=59620 RepID=UPI002638BDD7|nr:polyprenyl synthetase family protein [uncultured Clostridium sp.]
MSGKRIDESVYDEVYEYGLNYWKDLNDILEKEEYLEVLKEDLKEWNNNHINKGRFNYNFILKSNIKGYKPYLKYIKKKGMLDSYLDRSISYIFMRDLGKDITEKEVSNKIKDVVKDISATIDGKEKNIELEKIYNDAKDHGREDLVIWIINKMRETSENIPKGIDKVSAIRKIIKVIAGVLMYRVWDDNEKEKEVSKSVKIGYAYGITYPYIDDLLDSQILNEIEEEEYSNIIRETLVSGNVPKKEWNSENKEILNYVQSQLEEAFNYIKENQKEEKVKEFLELAYVFFHAQELDRKKSLDKEYKNEEIFVPVILKSAASRLIVPTILGKEKEDFNSNLFYYGIYNQLADDFTDMEEDYRNKRVTPYTYYMKNRKQAINPFKVYFAVIYYLTHKIYKNDSKVKDIIICRVINSLRRFKEKKREYNIDFIKLDHKELDRYLEEGIKNARNIEFYDKLLRDEIIERMNEAKEKKRIFKEKINGMKKEIDDVIGVKLDKSKIVEATNYSLCGNGKRLRSIITWIVGIESYGLKKESLVPLIKSLEYMHTASLILDDLPSQDNADLRRGKETIHKKYGVAIAELTSIFLTQQGIQEQTKLKGFNKEKIIELIEYTTEVIKQMCKGQSMDLESKGKNLSEEELEEICFYKTGIAFEAAVIMPAILGNAKTEEKEKLKVFAKCAGVAFQIKDDMLDTVGEREKLGKEIGIDKKNKTSTFVTILGYEEAEKKLFEYYVAAIGAIKGIERNVEFLKELMNYIMNRKS